MKKDLFNLQDKNSTSELLIIKEVVEESKSTIVFATEPIICSLADIFSNNQGKANLNSDSFESGVLSEIEISRGILNLAEGILYFHTIQKKLHLNISPESIVITVEGKWKFCSFGLSLTHSGEMGIGRLPSPYFLKSSFNDEGCDGRKIRLEPDLSYSCLEMTVGGINPPNVRYVTTAADVFSLGILAYEFYQFNLKSKDSRFHSRCIVSNNLMNHKEALDKLTYLDFSIVSLSLKHLLLGMIQTESSKRLSISDIINNSYFSSGSLAILKNIDTLQTRDIASQSTFLVGLSSQLDGFPMRILQNTILPTICNICNSNAALWMYVIPIHQFISKNIKITDYINMASPYIAKGLSIITPTECMQIFMKNINWLMETFNEDFFKDHIITLICNGLDINNESMQTQTLCILCKNEELRKSIDQKCLTDLIIPKVCKEACKNNVANIKILALYFLSLINSRIEKSYLAKYILPSLQYIIDNEKNPLVSMSVIGNYEVMSLSVGSDYIATQILPTSINNIY
jgi:SCY1-like protein 2